MERDKEIFDFLYGIKKLFSKVDNVKSIDELSDVLINFIEGITDVRKCEIEDEDMEILKLIKSLRGSGRYE